MAALVTAVKEAVLEDLTQRVYSSMLLDIETYKMEIQALSKQLKDLKKKFQRVDYEIESQEQYSRRNSACFYGINELPNENTDTLINNTVKDNLGIELHPTDLDRSHRIQLRDKDQHLMEVHGANAKKPRGIVVKFTRYNVRQSVFQAKTKLKDLIIWYHDVIKENITELCAFFSSQFDKDSNQRYVTGHEPSSIFWLHSLNISSKHKIYHAFLRLLYSYTKVHMKRDPHSMLPFIQVTMPHLQAELMTYCRGSVANLKMVLSVLIMCLKACVKACESAKQSGEVESNSVESLQTLGASWSRLVGDVCEEQWLEKMPYHEGPVGLGGSVFAAEEECEKSSEEYIRGDRMILRKLAQLVILGSELEAVSSGMAGRRGVRHLDQVSRFISSKLKETSQQKEETLSQGRWIFEIFGDQDDALIQIMLILLKINLSAKMHIDDDSGCTGKNEDVSDHGNEICAEKKGECILDAHHVFISFLDHMSLDHSILLDLLISTETDFLEYFIRYLRLVTTDWQGFVQVQKLYRRKEEDKNNVSCQILSSDDNSDDGDDDGDGDDDVVEGDDDDVSHSNNGCDGYDDDVIDEDDDGCEGGYEVGICKEFAEKFTDDADDDNSKRDVIENDVSRNEISAKKSNLYGQTGSERLPKSSEICPVKRKCDLEEGNENAARKTKRTEMEGLTNVTLPLEDTEEVINEDHTVHDGKNEVCVQSVSELGCLDDTMTILIRLRLAIERLDRKGLFPFSATPLIRILVKVEDMYEAVDG